MATENKVEKSESFWDYSWDDLKNEIISVVSLFQDQYLLVKNSKDELSIIHVDTNTDYGLRNSNTITIKSEEKDNRIDLKFEATNNLNRRLSSTKPFNLNQTINQFIELISKSLKGDLNVSKKYPSIQSEKILEIENDITKAKHNLQFNKSTSLILLGASLIVILLAATSFILQWKIWISVSLIVVFVIILFLTIGFGAEYFSSKAEIESLQSKRNIISGLPLNPEDKPQYYESLLQLNIENLDAYYRMVKIHTAQSFRVSLILSSIGILLITIGLGLGFNNTGDKAVIAYITAGSGVLIEIISSLLFYLYNKTVRQLKDYHDSLINAQNIFLSFKLVDSTENGPEKLGLIKTMLDALSKKSETNQAQ